MRSCRPSRIPCSGGRIPPTVSRYKWRRADRTTATSTRFLPHRSGSNLTFAANGRLARRSEHWQVSREASDEASDALHERRARPSSSAHQRPDGRLRENTMLRRRSTSWDVSKRHVIGHLSGSSSRPTPPRRTDPRPCGRREKVLAVEIEARSNGCRIRRRLVSSLSIPRIRLARERWPSGGCENARAAAPAARRRD